MAYSYYQTDEFSGGWHSGRIAVEVDSQSISGNYSIINLKLQVREDTNAYSQNNNGANVYLSVDGDKKVTDDSIDFSDFSTGTWYTILAKTGIKIYHESDGKQSISVKGYCATGTGAGTYSQTQTITLPTIPRKSKISSLTSSVSVNGTNAVTVGISRADSGFTHTVKFSIGSYSQSYTGVGTSKSFIIPLASLTAVNVPENPVNADVLIGVHVVSVVFLNSNVYTWVLSLFTGATFTCIFTDKYPPDVEVRDGDVVTSSATFNISIVKGVTREEA